MNSKVSKKLVMILKGFSTLLTLKGLLTSVDPFMNSKACTTNKALSTFLALIGFHISMDSLMLIELGLKSETGPTLLTFK